MSDETTKWRSPTGHSIASQASAGATETDRLLPRKQKDNQMRNWTPNKIIEQLEKCGFVDAMGHKIEMNDAFVFLKKALTIKAPKFFMNQMVSYKVVYKSASGDVLKQWANYYIVGIHRASDTDRVYYTYDLSNDPTQPYHYGQVNHSGVHEDYLQEQK